MNEKVIHAGFDVHAKTNVAHFLHPDGSWAHQPFEFEQDKKGFSRLEKALQKMAQEHPDVVFLCGIEATGPYWFPLGAFLTALPLRVKVTAINPSVVTNFKKVHLKKVKTDPIDARETAEYMRIFKPEPTDFFTSEHIALRQLARGRKFFLKQHSAAMNQLRSQLAVAFPEISGKDTNLSETILAVLDRFPSASSLKKATDKQLKKIRFPNSGKRVKCNMASALRETAKDSIGITQEPMCELYIRQLVHNIRFLHQQVQKAEKELETYYMEHFAHTRIHTIKGIGTLSAALIMGEILDAKRFESITHWIGYIGIYPEWKWSADKKDYAFKMTKKGNRYLKHIIYCCTFPAIRFNPIIRRHYHNQLSRGKKKMVAIGSCMRKLASLIFGVMKTQRDFDPLYNSGMKEKTISTKKTRQIKLKKEEAPQSNIVAGEVVNATKSFSGPEIEVASSL